MNIAGILKVAFKNIKNNKLRSVLTMLGLITEAIPIISPSIVRTDLNLLFFIFLKATFKIPAIFNS